MRQVNKDLNTLLNDLMAFLATNAGDEPNATGIVLVRRVVKTLRRRQAVVGLPVLQSYLPRDSYRVVCCRPHVVRCTSSAARVTSLVAGCSFACELSTNLSASRSQTVRTSKAGAIEMANDDSAPTRAKTHVYLCYSHSGVKVQFRISMLWMENSAVLAARRRMTEGLQPGSLFATRTAQAARLQSIQPQNEALMEAEQSSPIINDSGLGATLMPDQRRAQGIRLVAWFLFIWGLIIGIYAAKVISFDLYVRSHWRIVDGDILRYEQKSAQIGSSRSRPTYWIEFEVEFDPKEAGCNTGSNWGIEKPFPCIGTVKSPGSQSFATASGWIQRHPPNSPARFYYDPATGRLRFAGESIANIYPWGAILAFIAGAGGGVLLLSASRRRLQYLKTLPATEGVTSSSSSDKPRPDELIDMKLL